jgi:hypothetical protein
MLLPGLILFFYTNISVLARIWSGGVFVVKVIGMGSSIHIQGVISIFLFRYNSSYQRGIRPGDLDGRFPFLLPTPACGGLPTLGLYSGESPNCAGGIALGTGLPNKRSMVANFLCSF